MRGEMPVRIRLGTLRVDESRNIVCVFGLSVRFCSSSFLVPVPPGAAYMLRHLFLGLTCNPVGTAFWLSGSIPEVCSRFHGVAACDTDGIARISPLEHVGDKRLPALIRWLMTEGEARPNGCIYMFHVPCRWW